MSSSGLVLHLCAAAAVTIATAQDIATAIAQTAAGDWAGAEATYREVARQDPQRGLPALGRFLALTGTEEQLRTFLQDTVRDETLPPQVRTRLLLQAEQPEAAIAFLRDALARDDSPALAWFAAGVYARTGVDEEAGRIYLRLLRQASDRAAADQALAGLMAHPSVVTVADRDLLERWLLEADFPVEERLAFLDAVAAGWGDSLRLGEESPSPFGTLLASVIRFAQGDLAQALAELPEPSAKDPAGKLWALQRIRILSRQGQSEEAGRWATWLLGGEPSAPQASWESPLQTWSTEVYDALERRDADAAQRAVQLIQMRPFDPETMRRLMRYYRETGTGDPERVPDLAGAKATNPQLLGQCGYVLATEGFPAPALVYYDRALAIDPEDPFVRMNRAACLTRLNRLDEAEGIYRDLLEHGHHGRPYHVHELLMRLWVLMEAEEQEAECLDYFQDLATRKELPWRDQIIEGAVNLMHQLGRPEDAPRFAPEN